MTFSRLCRLLLFFVLVQCVSLYKIYALDGDDTNRLDMSRNALFSSYPNDDARLRGQFKWNDDDDDDASTNDRTEDFLQWLSSASAVKDRDEQISLGKRSAFPFKSLPQRRNNRPHWNPLMAAYKRCGELSLPNEREACFKNAIQMIFVHKLRK